MSSDTQNYITVTLSNGLRVIYFPTAVGVSQPSCATCFDRGDIVYCGYAVKAGSRNETPSEYGIAHLCEHMAFKGTERLTAVQVLTSLEKYGAEVNAFTSKEETVYYATTLGTHFNKVVDTLTEIVFHSVYRPSDLETEKEVVCDEIESYNDTPQDLVYDEFENEIFVHSPLGHSILGNADDVRGFTSANCQDFVRRWYTPSNTVFYVVGNINLNQLVKRLERLLSDFPQAAPVLPANATTAAILKPHADYNERNNSTHQAHVVMGVAYTSDRKRWRTPLLLANNILGGGSMNSRLNLMLRERHGLVYTVESSIANYQDATLWSLYFGTDKTDVRRCLKLAEREIEKLRTLSPAMLRAAKTQIKGQIALSCSRPENIAIDLAKQYLHRSAVITPSAVSTLIDAVEAADIHALIETILKKENFEVMVLC